jgi:hypothetical protein
VSVSQLACGYCGSSQQVIREGGTITLELMDSLSKVSQSADRAAAEMAIRRLSKDLQEARNHRPMIEIQGAQKIKAIRDRFQMWMVFAVFGPIILATIAGAALLEQKPANASLFNGFIILGCALSAIAMLALFFFMRPAGLVRIEELKMETRNELAAMDSRIAEIESALKRNTRIANS